MRADLTLMWFYQRLQYLLHLLLMINVLNWPKNPKDFRQRCSLLLNTEISSSTEKKPWILILGTTTSISIYEEFNNRRENRGGHICEGIRRRWFHFQPSMKTIENKKSIWIYWITTDLRIENDDESILKETKRSDIWSRNDWTPSWQWRHHKKNEKKSSTLRDD